MKVQCIFDDKDHVARFNNILTVSNGCIVDEVVIQILDSDGKDMVSTAVDGNALIKAIQNAMNV